MSAFSAALETYLRECRRIGGMPATERSYYPALRDLFDAVGRTLKPNVSATTELAGEHHPDLGLFEMRARSATADGAPDPDRGVIEVKLPDADINAIADGEQVRGYRERYGRVLVTNLREFLLVTSGPDGRSAFGERFTLAENPAAFSRLLAHPRQTADRSGDELGEYLVRAFEHQTTIGEPRVLARLLASHARDARARVSRAEDGTAVAAVREALEEALGIKFEDERGVEFFRSTLVQTLFYGVFAAWVQWSRSQSTNVLNKTERERERESSTRVLMERVGMAAALAGPENTVPATGRPGQPRAAGLGRSARLGAGGLGEGGPGRVLAALRERGSGGLFL